MSPRWAYRPCYRLLLVVPLSALLTSCSRPDALAQGPDPGKAPAGEPRMESVTLVAEGLELFLEHPVLVRGEAAKFNVHLTVLKDGAPIRSGRLEAVGTGPRGRPCA